ncbi:MAG: ChbG/HpnK family deacetylase [Caldilineae bacterium]|nr:MAG: ChbG/HpnK family deacetylase [Caldilineae bacterium]
MQTNPFLQKLGFAARDRVVIFHADDIGMCHASYQAYVDLVEAGLISAASTMVPCSWFPAVAAFCRHQSDDTGVDMGVHITLTSEWDAYRWRPLVATDPEAGLIDDEGYLYRDESTVQERAQAEWVAYEMEAQLKRALEAGIDVTHLDSHMGAVFHPRFIDTYLDLARRYRLPALLLRRDEAGLQAMGYDPATAAQLAARIRACAEEGLVLMDEIVMMPLDHGRERMQRVEQALKALPPGLTYFIVHPAQDTPELRALAPDWPARVADFEVFRSEALRTVLRNTGIYTLGMRVLRDHLRQASDSLPPQAGTA